VYDLLMKRDSSGVLPYTDSKPQGAADFYFAINATFRFLLDSQPGGAWEDYLEQLGREYFAPVNSAWKEEGLPMVAEYWRAFFGAEPGSEVVVEEGEGRVEIDVKVCPAIRHFRTQGRCPVSRYCEHCEILGQARARAAGMGMSLVGGNGSCRHTYFEDPDEAPARVPGSICEATL
tara:strand:- start:642 stop:1169 length:528 start_codon:yes stop_codon:yes gene_type:complete